MNNSILNIFRDKSKESYIDNNELYSINSMVQEEYEKKIDTLLDGLFYNDKWKKETLIKVHLF